MDSVTQERVRPLSTQDLKLEPPQGVAPVTAGATKSGNHVETLPGNDALLSEVRAALAMGFAGVILSGPPGTGKSYFAERIAHTIADDPSAVRVVQFHASYQYEDFMQGFAPADDGSGFELQNKVFPLVCKEATDNPKTTFVILIDEISRCDVARVFGEALTYLEPDKRGRIFQLASGKPLSVPPNLIILATMNPWDKGVDELDVALERRFAQIDMPPDPVALRKILTDKKADPAFIDRVVTFFQAIQRLDDDMVHLGHAYFNNCVDEDSARRAWAFRLLPFFTKACRLDKEMLANIKRLWLKVVPPVTNENTAPDDAAEATENVAANDQPAPDAETEAGT
ncbi:AAA family ATPase [Aquamicrobium lusatiense]|uniref:McrB family protein n=1 Tax=Aquamicrobium lusatiense TaxID=89772 RepID=UPI002457748B|nr:AAA family ATPase [Aquamicrobium lusatiense]MDH4992234.1 AAA family ATPase [Aquamicrobium lusatiense]